MLEGMEGLVIRRETPSDWPDIREVNEQAFGRSDEADVIELIRMWGAVTLSLVAEYDGRIVGHVLFTPAVIVRDGRDRQRIQCLAPMAVHPEKQKQGIGTQMAKDGIDILREEGHTAIVVLGHPSYYPRFGFTPASKFGLSWEQEAADEAFMALELLPGALDDCSGMVKLRPEFFAAM